MPELPEVEIVKQSLNKSITGKIISCLLYTSDAADD